jgi:hypothetical protein
MLGKRKNKKIGILRNKYLSISFVLGKKGKQSNIIIGK